jgi:hypothetical protein
MLTSAFFGVAGRFSFTFDFDFVLMFNLSLALRVQVGYKNFFPSGGGRNAHVLSERYGILPLDWPFRRISILAPGARQKVFT